MDIEGLRGELEEHLKKNPDENAPNGFRDRFSATLEQYEAEPDEKEKAEIADVLRRIRAEAEAAANCAMDHDRSDDATPDAPPEATAPQPAAPAEPAPPTPKPEAASRETADAGEDDAPAPGVLQRFGLPLVVALIVLAAAYFFLR